MNLFWTYLLIGDIYAIFYVFMVRSNTSQQYKITGFDWILVSAVNILFWPITIPLRIWGITQVVRFKNHMWEQHNVRVCGLAGKCTKEPKHEGSHSSSDERWKEEELF